MTHVQLKHVFNRLCQKAHVKSTLIFSSQIGVGARTNVLTHNISLYSGCLKAIGVTDTIAILAHEIGHLQQHQIGTLASLIVSNCAIMLICLALPLTLYFWTLVVLMIAYFCTLVIFSRKNEEDADIRGAKLIGSKNMIHMLKRVEHHHQKIIQQFQAMIQQGAGSLWANIAIKFLYLLLKINDNLERRNLALHPTIPQRIKLIKQSDIH